MKKYFIFFAVFLTLFFIASYNPVFAYVIEDLNFKNEGDIVVGPGKTELFLSGGDNYTREISVSNRTGSQKIIKIEVEDFKASSNPDSTIQFLGSEKGPYSLKDYVKPDVNEIVLNHGQRLRLYVQINIPENAEPGGLYGAVMVSASNIDKGSAEIKKDAAAGKLKIITQVASLLFVRIKGDVFEEGILKDFKAEKFYEKGPVIFKIISQNTGNVHLLPYGAVEIKNILGSKVGEVQIDPWFVMPKSERIREVRWNSNFLLGRYTASVSLNRGYEDIIDVKTFSFWVIPWKLLTIVLIVLILFIWLIVWLATHLQFKKDAPPPPPQSTNFAGGNNVNQ